MTTDAQQIMSVSRTIRELLSTGNRYTLDFYQREYSWGEEQVVQLIDDLVSGFQSEYDSEKHERKNVANYRNYFLGPIITELRDGVRHLIDGQQRITTLGLLLMHLYHNLAKEHAEDSGQLMQLIFTQSYGSKTFKINVEERDECLSTIWRSQEFDVQSESSASVRNLWYRYKTISDYFPEDWDDKGLLCFTDWLLNKVTLVDIAVADNSMAEDIFQTMNDRGLRLSNTDKLKSFLIARVGEDDEIRRLNDEWRRRITELTDIEKNADSEFIKAWLRSKYAETQREGGPGASPRDFESIHTAFHKWVRDKCSQIGLKNEGDYRRFVEHEFLGLSARYMDLLRASRNLTCELEPVYHNASTGFTLQLLAILSVLSPDDDNETFFKNGISS